MSDIKNSSLYSLSITSTDENLDLAPENIPAIALGEYIQEFTKVLSTQNNNREVLFTSVTKGCVQISLTAPEVEGDILKNKFNNNSSFAAIEKTLRKYNHKAIIRDAIGTLIKEIIPARVNEIEIYQEDSFRGQIIKVGGRDKDNVPVSILTSDSKILSLTVRGESLAKQMAAFLYGPIIECYGSGYLKLNTDTLSWLPVPQKFIITSFSEIKNINVDSFLKKFREINSQWKSTDNPLGLIKKIRDEDET